MDNNNKDNSLGVTSTAKIFTFIEKYLPNKEGFLEVIKLLLKKLLTNLKSENKILVECSLLIIRSIF